MRPLLAAALALAFAAPAFAQEGGKAPAMPKEPPGKPSPARVVAGTYAVDPEHTLVAFTLAHMGFTPYFGLFGAGTGELKLDPKHLADAKVRVTIPLERITVTNADLKKHLSTPDFFDVAKFPTATFVSTKVTPTGPTTATIAGELTLKGKATPVTLNARFVGAGENMMPKTPAVGFEAETTVSRTALGLGYGVPMVGDRVDLKIAAAFNRTGD